MQLASFENTIRVKMKYGKKHGNVIKEGAKETVSISIFEWLEDLHVEA